MCKILLTSLVKNNNRFSCDFRRFGLFDKLYRKIKVFLKGPLLKNICCKNGVFSKVKCRIFSRRDYINVILLKPPSLVIYEHKF